MGGGLYEAVCSIGGVAYECIGFGGTNEWECFGQVKAALVYQTSSIDCVRGVAGIRKDSDGWVRTRHGSYASVLSGGVSCSSPWARPEGFLSVKTILKRWNGSAWVTCQETPWLYSLSAGTYYAGNLGWGPAPCGAGYYGAHVGAYEKYNGVWNGGWVWSDYIYVS
jgi:hypothetical protein